MGVSLLSASKLKLVDDRSTAFSKLQDKATLDLSLELLSGAGLGKIDAVYRERRILEGSESLNLRGELLDYAGRPFNFARLKLVALQLENAAAASLLGLGGSAATIFAADGDQLKIGPGGLLLWMNPSAAGVAVAFGDLLDLTFLDSADEDLVVDLLIAGEKVAASDDVDPPRGPIYNPGNPTAQTKRQTSESIAVDWTPIAVGARYEVAYGLNGVHTDPSDEGVIVSDPSAVDARTLTIEGLDPATDYIFWTRAVRGAEASDWVYSDTEATDA